MTGRGWCVQGGPLNLEIFRSQASSFCNSGQHFGPDLLVVVKCEDEIRPVGVGECLVGAGLTLGLPANSQQGGENAPGLGGGPAAQAA